ncbi:MAG: SOS response-associated peptidase family protein [Candidatus Saccharimonadaceae bacterium]
MPSFVVNEEQARDMQNKTLTARANTIYERKSYNDIMIIQRCALMVHGFFEWRHTATEKYVITFIQLMDCFLLGLYLYKLN